MNTTIKNHVNKSKKDHSRQKRVMAAFLVLALVVTTAVTWNLHGTGIAFTDQAMCGKEEHTHDDSCYESRLICGQDEESGHVHTEECYEKVLICGKEEHTHTIACYSDIQADLETNDVWEATLPAELTGNYAENVLAVAESQVGYAESEKNFRIADDGETKMGYNRYGAWYGNPYGEWNAMFVSFCLHYAGVPENEIPQGAGAYAWAAALKEAGIFAPVADVAAGDILFFDADGDGNADHVGIVSEVVRDEAGEVTTYMVIEGDVDNQVLVTDIAANDSTLIGMIDLADESAIEDADQNNEEQPTEAESESAEAETEAETDAEPETDVAPEETPDANAETEEAVEEEKMSQTVTEGAYTVTVTYGADANLPENAELRVREIAKDSEEFAAQCEEAGKTFDWLLDIGFYAGEEKVEPQAMVDVEIRIAGAESTTSNVTHFTENGEVQTYDGDSVESNTENDEEVIRFQTDSFSIFGGSSEDVDTYANATQKTFTFNSNNGSNRTKTMTGMTDAMITLPDAGNWTNGQKTFMGWSVNSNYTTKSNSYYYTSAFYTAGQSVGVEALAEKGTTLYAVWADSNVTATFYIRKDGLIPTEPSGHPNSEYTSGIQINGVLKKGCFYTNSGTNGVNEKLNSVPTTAQIRQVLPSYNENTQYVLWYVIKNEDIWHVDGVVLSKQKVNLSYVPNCTDWTANTMPDGSQFDKNATAKVGHHAGNNGEVRTPQRPGYTFLGWNTSADGTGTWYQNDNEIKMDTDKTLYAQWSADAVTPPTVETETELSRNKYVKDNGDGTYDLTLDVSGAIGTSTETAKVDIMLVVDTSGSMSNRNRLVKTKSAIRNMIDTMKEKENVETRWNLVTFNTRAAAATGWTSDGDAFYRSNISRLSANGGTNYEDAFSKAITGMRGAQGKKIIIFLTDGGPTYYNSGNSVDGWGSITDQTTLDKSTAAASKITANVCNEFYAVGVNMSSQKDGDYDYWGRYYESVKSPADCMADVFNSVSLPTTKKQQLAVTDEDADFSAVFNSIAGSVTNLKCTKVTVDDTFSEYAKATSDANLVITVKNGSGTVIKNGTGSVVMPKTTVNNSDAEAGRTLTASFKRDGDGKITGLTLNFPADYQLEEDYVYSVTTKIEPTKKAYEDYDTNNNGYGNVKGDADTDAPNNDTSSGHPGFRCNTKAEVKYTYNNHDESSLYPHPVIQVPTKNVTAEKQWDDNYDGVADDVATVKAEHANDKIVLQLYRVIGDQKTAVGDPVEVEAGENFNWQHVFSGLQKYTFVEGSDEKQEIQYEVVETAIIRNGTKYDSPEAAGYEVSYSTADGKFIVTNKANVPTTSLTVEKRLQVPAGTNVGKKFPFTVTITGTAKELVGLKNAAGDGYTIWAKKNGGEKEALETAVTTEGDNITLTVHFELGHEDTVELLDIPTNAAYAVEEGNTDGFHVLSIATKAGETNTEGAVYSAKVQPTADFNYVVYTNVTDYELPKTGGIGTTPFTLGGSAILITGILVYGVVTYRRKKAA